MASLQIGIKAKNEQRYRRAKLYFNRAIEYDQITIELTITQDKLLEN